MCPSDNTYVETMCSCNGIISLMDYHNQRLNHTRHDLFGCNDNIDLRDYVSPDAKEPCLKIRAVYGINGITEVTYAPYKPKDIKFLHLVYDDNIDYSYKSSDRTRLQSLAAQKGDCDEVLIIRNNLITDTSYTNVAVYVRGKWLTPRLPLLKGTRRASLLDKGLIIEADIHPDDITDNTEIMLFNAMMDFGTCIARLKR